VIVYAYQTDRSGNYPASPALRGFAARHGRLRGWARTDAAGRYTFETIRPGAYPGRKVPQHIHLHVIEPGRCTYYLGDVLFDDDPLLTPALRARESDAHGGNGIVVAKGDAKVGWRVTRDITLGRNVADYAACTTHSASD
jgi:protocatechuate 3,4-dioxygenase beta subunit